jgi:cytochrome P450
MSAVVRPSAVAGGEPSLPISQVDLGEFSRDLMRGMRWLHDTHGPIGAIEDRGQRVVFLFSPEFNQQVLSDTDTFHSHFFPIRGPKNSAQRRVTCGLLQMNGEQHRRNRRIVKEPFGLRSISTYGETIVRLTEGMLATWQPGETRDMAEEMRQYMLRVTSTILFGMDDSAAAYRLGDMIAEWVGMIHEAGVGALVPNDTFTHLYEKLLVFAESLESEIRAMIRKRRQESDAGSDVLSILVRSHDEEGGLSDEELVGQAAVLFAAAHMTTAHSLTWTLFLLAQHPQIMRQLWIELNESGDQSAFSANGERFGPKAVGSLPKGEELSLLDRVIKESMRLLPASAYSQRIATCGVQIGPLYLSRGTAIVFTPLVTHHLAEFYREPERFLPDRWITLRPSPYAYHPFGGGPRLCIGGPLATAIIRLALQQILSRFRLTVVPGANIGVHVESTMLVPTNGVPMEVAAADGNYRSSPIVGSIHELVDFDVPAKVSLAPRRPK